MSDSSTDVKTESLEEETSADGTIPSPRMFVLSYENENIDDKGSSKPSIKISRVTSVKKPRKSRFNNCAICGIIKNNVSFHRFPTAPDIRAQWAVFCGLDVDKLGSFPVICGNHFAEDDFVDHKVLHGDRKLLKKNSVPSRNPPKNHNHDVYSSEELIYETIIVDSVSDNITHPDDEITTDFAEQNDSDDIDIISDDDTCNTNSDDATVTPSGDGQKRLPLTCKRKFPRYFMDIKNEDVSSPKYAQLCLELGRQAIFNYRKKINALQNQNKRLQNKLLSAENIIRQLRNNTISMDEALSTIESKQIFTFANKGCFI